MKQKNTHKSSCLSTRAEIQLIACFSKIIKEETAVRLHFHTTCIITTRSNIMVLFLGRPQLHMTGVFFNSEASTASAASPHPDHLCHYHHGHSTGPPTMINHNNNVYGNRTMTLDAASLGLVSSKKAGKGALRQRVRKVTSPGRFESAATDSSVESYGTFGGATKDSRERCTLTFAHTYHTLLKH